MTTIETLNQIFRRVFDDDTIELHPDMIPSDIDRWDSLSHFNLITSVEGKFNIRFTHKELVKPRNVGELIANIDRKLAA